MANITLLREAIAAFKAGQRQYARELFLELVEREPTNELAWIWLSGLLESRDEQIKALENSLTIGEGGFGAQPRLHEVGSSIAGKEQAKFRDAIKAVESGRVKKGRHMLEQIITENSDHEQAWMALSQLVDDDEEKIRALENVVRINPNNFKAREDLTKVQHLLYQNYLSLGHAYQTQEEYNKAVESYKLAEKFASSGAFRSAARQRWEIILEKSKESKIASPTLTLLRLAIGPPLLFGFLILIQSGLKPWQVSPLFCLGGLVVTVGSLMAVASTHTPHHPIWLAIWGRRGLTDSTRRTLLRNLGFLLMLVPFLVWLISAIMRLGVLLD